MGRHLPLLVHIYFLILMIGLAQRKASINAAIHAPEIRLRGASGQTHAAALKEALTFLI